MQKTAKEQLRSFMKRNKVARARFAKKMGYALKNGHGDIKTYEAKLRALAAKEEADVTKVAAGVDVSDNFYSKELV